MQKLKNIMLRDVRLEQSAPHMVPSTFMNSPLPRYWSHCIIVDCSLLSSLLFCEVLKAKVMFY